MIVSDNTFLYFFSTYAQSIAALVGLSATFAVYYYQNLRSSLNERSLKIYETFHGNFRGLLTQEERKIFRNFTAHEQRVPFVKTIYENWMQESKKQDVLSLFNGNRDLIEAFYSYKDEFAEFNKVTTQMFSFRRIFLTSSSIGLFLIFFGMASLNLTDIPELKEKRFSHITIFLIITIPYLTTLFYMFCKTLDKTNLTPQRNTCFKLRFFKKIL